MVIILVLGFVSFTSLSTELMPSINLPYAIVTTVYQGASPEQIETMVTKPIEGAMATVSNIENVSSVSQENLSMVILEFNESTNMDSVIIEMRETLDQTTAYLPEDVQSPTITKINPDMMPIMTFSVSVDGENASEEISFIEDTVLPRIERIQGVANVSLSGAIDQELQITLNDEKIEDANASFQEEAFESVREEMREELEDQGIPESMIESMLPTELALDPLPITEEMISGILAGQNISFPNGYIEEGDIDYLVRTGDDFTSVEDVENLPIISSEYGTIYLNEVADIEMVVSDDESYTKVNGEDAIMFVVEKQSNAVTTEVTDEILSEIESLEVDYDNVTVNMLFNQGEYINRAVGSVQNNLLLGAVLAIIILFVFLKDLKPTLIIGLAIPISLLAAFTMIYFFGITLNVISMGGLALGIGMLVDNAIVVIENIFRLRKEGYSVKEASIEGAGQVAGAITASTLTTVAVFLPIIFTGGLTAEIFQEMALTVTASLVASLLIALTLVPAMSSKMFVKPPKLRKDPIMSRLFSVYSKGLNWSLKHKAITMILVVLLLAGSVFGALQVGTEFMPTSQTGSISASVNFSDGTTFSEAEEHLNSISQDIVDMEQVETVGVLYGSGAGSMMSMSFMSDAEAATLYVTLKEDYTDETTAVSTVIRDMVQDDGLEITISDQANSMTAMTGEAISVNVKGYEFDELEIIANDVTEIIEDIEGTTEVDDGITKSEEELKITVDREKSIENGLTNAQVYEAVSEVTEETEAVTTLSENGQEYDIYVIDPDVETTSVDDIKKLEIENTQGEMIVLEDVANVEFSEGFGTISRDNQIRTINVTASIEDEYNIGIVADEVETALEEYETPDGYTIEMEGESELINSALSDLTLAGVVGILLIYLVMAAQFESLLYPFIVLFTIPLAYTGGFLALVITGFPVSVIAAVGLIVLTGIVVNNGIVLVDHINLLKESGELSTHEALLQAGKDRMRPILMTALTTSLALVTMALGMGGEGAEMMQPMAITTIGGLIYATILTLLVVPVMYYIFDKIKEKFHAGNTHTEEDGAVEQDTVSRESEKEESTGEKGDGKADEPEGAE
jgi:HAE1 family hydrophobic/amphiphilic exporter-1